MGFQHPFFAIPQTLLKLYGIPHLCNRCSTNTISITNNASSTRCNTSRCITNNRCTTHTITIAICEN